MVGQEHPLHKVRHRYISELDLACEPRPFGGRGGQAIADTMRRIQRVADVSQ